MSIENQTLAHFRHFISLLTNENRASSIGYPVTSIKHQESSYLRAYKAYSTNVECSLQIRLFLQNKANFLKSQMDISKVLTRKYEKKTLGERGKNKANSKPNKANTNPKQTQYKTNQSQFQKGTITH